MRWKHLPSSFFTFTLRKREKIIVKTILKCLLNMFVYAWMCALTHFSYYKFKVDYIFLPEELSAWMENKYCKVPLSKVSVVWERWFKFIVYLFVVNICSVQTLYKHWTGWPLNRMILSKYWKEADEIWILPGKTREEKCVCFLFACRKHVLLVSWFARFALCFWFEFAP